MSFYSLRARISASLHAETGLYAGSERVCYRGISVRSRLLLCDDDVWSTGT